MDIMQGRRSKKSIGTKAMVELLDMPTLDNAKLILEFLRKNKAVVLEWQDNNECEREIAKYFVERAKLQWQLGCKIKTIIKGPFDNRIHIRSGCHALV